MTLVTVTRSKGCPCLADFARSGDFDLRAGPPCINSQNGASASGCPAKVCPARPLQFQRSHSMRHLMPIVTPRLILRPPTLGDLDSIQAAKEEAWPDLQRWMTWAFENQRSRQAMEDSIRRTMDYQNKEGIALAAFHRINGDFVVRTALDLTDEQDVYETGYWMAPKYAGQGMATEAGNEPSRRIVDKLGFQKLRIAPQAATRCLDGMKLDRHEYTLTSPDSLPELG